MTKSNLTKSVAIILLLMLIVTSVPLDSFGESKISNDESNVLTKEETIVTEDVTEEEALQDESSEDYTVFDLGDNKRMLMYYGEPVRFENEEGELEEYNPELIEIKEKTSIGGQDLSQYEFENNAGDSKQYIPTSINEESPILMEKDKYSVQISANIDDLSNVELEKDEVVDAYDNIEEKEVNAVYSSDEENLDLIYTSQNTGLKESIVLNEKPESNIFKYTLKLSNLIPEMDEATKNIVLKDKETKKEIACIDKPFMNDATGEAYSEDIGISIIQQDDDTYLLTLQVSKKYLNAKERQYPITIDPSTTWKGSSKLYDAYILSSYPTYNYNTDAIKLITAGKGAQGTFRTYLKFDGLASALKNKYVDSAKLTLYETGEGYSGKTVKAFRVSTSYTIGKLTWNNKPSNDSTALDSFKTNGKIKHACTLDLTSFARNIANQSKSNNGIMLKESSEDSKTYTEFYGTSYSSSDYRPKLVVTYFDGPSKATKIATTKYNSSDSKYENASYFKTGVNQYATWAGIKSKNLSCIQYKYLADGNGASIKLSSADVSSYASIGKATESGSNVKIPHSSELKEGKYKVYIRGKDAGGIYGTGISKTIYVDGKAPTISDFSITPNASSNCTGDATPKISWNVTDTFFSNVKIKVDDAVKYTHTSAGKGSYVLKEGDITSSGKHTISVVATDKAGRVTTKSQDYIVDLDAPEIKNVIVTPETTNLSPSTESKPTFKWQIDDEDFAYTEILLNDEILYKSTAKGTLEYVLQTELEEAGEHVFQITAYDKAGNKNTKTVNYYFDSDAPEFTNLNLSESTNFLSYSKNPSPRLNWEIDDAGAVIVKAKIDNGSEFVLGKEKYGSYDFSRENWVKSGKEKYEISVWAEDGAGNKSDVETMSYYFDDSIKFEELVPANLKVEEHYGKNVLSWETEARDDCLGRVDIYRSTKSDFSDEVCIKQGAKGDTYIDNQILQEGTYYYKLSLQSKDTAKRLDSNIVKYQQKDLANALSRYNGEKEYLGYSTFSTQIGSGSVEESSGNLLYQATDFSIENAEFDYGFNRTYNSLNDLNTVMGKGWLDSYHKEIYENGDKLLFMDTSGAIYTFEKEGEKYFTIENLSLTLEKTTEGYLLTEQCGTKHYFNEYGQWVKSESLTGDSITNVYDDENNIVKVISNVNRVGAEKKVIISYNDNSQIERVTAPNEVSASFEYEDGYLKEIKYSDRVSEYDYSSGKLSNIFDAEGNKYTVSYGTDGKVAGIVNPLKEKDVFTYSQGKTKVSSYDENGNLDSENTVTYDINSGKKLSEVDMYGDKNNYVYGSGKQSLLVTLTKTPIGYETFSDDGTVKINNSMCENRSTYDDKGNLIREESSMGELTLYKYDAYGNEIERKEYDDGTLIEYEETQYDDKGRAVLEYDKVENTKTETKYKDDIIVTVEYEDGAIVSTEETTFDGDGNELSIILKNENGAVVEKEESVFDEMNNEISSVREDMTETLEYDDFGEVIFSTRAVEGKGEQTTEIEYDLNGDIKSVSTSDGTDVEYEYDVLGNKVSITESGSGIETVTTTTEDKDIASLTTADGVKHENIHVTTTKVNGKITEVKYNDSEGNTIRTESGGIVTDCVYDDSNNEVVSYIGAKGSNDYTIQVTANNEDGKTFATIVNAAKTSDGYKMTDDSIVTTSEFDKNGNEIKSVDGEGNVTTMTYDDKDRQISFEQGDMVQNTSYEKDGDTEKTVVTDSNGNQKEELSNLEGDPVEITDVDNVSDDIKTTALAYDEKGNKIKETYADGSYSTFEYDAYDNIIKQITFTANDEKQEEIGYDYDINNLLMSVITKKGEEVICEKNYEYDVRGNMTSAKIHYKGETTDVINYEYDALSRVIEISYPSRTDLGNIEYIYDDMGNVKEINKDGDIVCKYEYNALNQLVKVYNYEKLNSQKYILREYKYDDFGRTTEIETKIDNALIEKYTYVYDKNNHVTKVSRVNNADVKNKINCDIEYSYDNMNQLVKSVKTDNLLGQTTVSEYEYDSVGNKVKEIVDGVETTYDYNGFNQMIKKETPDEEIIYTYDELGNEIMEENTTEEIITRYDYSVRGNMTSVSVSRGENSPKVIQNNIYDENGERLLKSEGNDSTYYFYDGGIAYTTDGNNVKTANLYDDNGCVLSIREKGDDYYNYLSDAQGSTSIIMKDGKANNIYEYSDFGETNLVTDDIAIDNEICYTGAVLDNTTGLYYMNARYYNPSNSRFISQDTYRGEEDDPMTWNLYAYCANDPINYTDPSGHKYKDITRSLNKQMIYDAKQLYSYASGIKKKYSVPFWARIAGYFSSLVKLGNALYKRTGTKQILTYFINRVKSTGKWDLKLQKKWQPRTYGVKKFIYRYRHHRYRKAIKLDAEDVGNMHFGYVGAVLFSRNTLCIGAGIYQIYQGHTQWSWWRSYFDEPRDNEMIRFGYNLWSGSYNRRVFGW